MVKKRIATVIIPNICLLVSFVFIAVLIAKSWVAMDNIFEVGIKYTLPFVLIWLLVCVAVASCTVICIFNKNKVSVISAVCVVVALIITTVTITNIYLEDGMGDMGLVVIVNTARNHFRSFLFWVTACIGTASTIVFVISLFIKKGEKNYETKK